MKESLLRKLEIASERREEIGLLLGQADVLSDATRYQALSKEFSQLGPIVETFHRYQNVLKDRAENDNLLRDPDPELRQMAEEEYKDLSSLQEKLEQELQILLLPRDENDERNIYLEIRGGAGGDEAAIFAGDLYRMYTRYAEKQRWSVELVSRSDGEHGGFKEVIVKISGQNVYARLKFESGAHRVQRVPTTESQGRVHTSTCTVAILPEVDEISDVEINSADLRIDTYRASGAGGQHVNKTDSAIRITHLPSGLVVECQDERSQHKNRAKAMSLLKSRLLAAQQTKQQQEQAQSRRILVGTGDRSERIRTYNFPQGRLTDHRINLTIYKLSDVVEGDLDAVIDPLIHEYQADLLAEMGG